MKGGNGVRKANVVTLRRAWLRKRTKKTHALVRKVLKSMRSLRPLRLKILRRTKRPRSSGSGGFSAKKLFGGFSRKRSPNNNFADFAN